MAKWIRRLPPKVVIVGSIPTRDIFLFFIKGFKHYNVINIIMSRALILKDPYASLVVSGEKTLEIRNMRTKKIGKEIYIAKSGTKTLIGKVTIDKCKLLSVDEFNNLAHLHHALDYQHGKNIYGWFLKNAVKFDKPVPYNHPHGAQTWVIL